MTYTITNTQRKLLTEKLLDECWHEYILNKEWNTKNSSKPVSSCSCGNRGVYVWECCIKANRTFTSPADQKAVMRKLVEKGLWEEFTYYSKEHCIRSLKVKVPALSKYTEWLFLEEERFCWLAGEFMKERRMKDA